ncbi:hypothetical protein Q5752_006238 [Cryptotrichosporon argae]
MPDEFTGKTPNFLQKLYDFINLDPHPCPEIIYWATDSRQLVIAQPDRLAKEVLPRLFKHDKLASFGRQLNIYGFSRLFPGRQFKDADGNISDASVWAHPSLHRLSTPAEIAAIKRRAAPKLIRTRRLANGEVVHSRAGPAVEAKYREVRRTMEESRRARGSGAGGGLFAADGGSTAGTVGGLNEHDAQAGYSDEPYLAPIPEGELVPSTLSPSSPTALYPPSVFSTSSPTSLSWSDTSWRSWPAPPVPPTTPAAVDVHGPHTHWPLQAHAHAHEHALVSPLAPLRIDTATAARTYHSAPASAVAWPLAPTHALWPSYDPLPTPPFSAVADDYDHGRAHAYRHSVGEDGALALYHGRHGASAAVSPPFSPAQTLPHALAPPATPRIAAPASPWPSWPLEPSPPFTFPITLPSLADRPAPASGRVLDGLDGLGTAARASVDMATARMSIDAATRVSFDAATRASFDAVARASFDAAARASFDATASRTSFDSAADPTGILGAHAATAHVHAHAHARGLVRATAQGDTHAAGADAPEPLLPQPQPTTIDPRWVSPYSSTWTSPAHSRRGSPRPADPHLADGSASHGAAWAEMGPPDRPRGSVGTVGWLPVPLGESLDEPGVADDPSPASLSVPATSGHAGADGVDTGTGAWSYPPTPRQQSAPAPARVLAPAGGGSAAPSRPDWQARPGGTADVLEGAAV